MCSSIPQAQEHELKFLFPSHRIDSIVQWLNHLCRPDPQFPRNRIATMYYDTLDRQFLGEKRESDYQKTKVRVRWYNSEAPSHTDEGTWLEIKQKIGSQRRKLRISLPYSQATLATLPLEHPIMRVEIPRQLAVNGIAVKTAIVPMFLLEYERRRFFDPLHRVRICVDSRLSVPKVNRQLFPAGAFVPNHVAVLEVKGNVTCLPNSLRRLHELGCVKTSFSKYEVCYQQLLPEGA